VFKGALLWLSSGAHQTGVSRVAGAAGTESAGAVGAFRAGLRGPGLGVVALETVNLGPQFVMELVARTTRGGMKRAGGRMRRVKLGGKVWHEVEWNGRNGWDSRTLSGTDGR
jgi:hypothetical protein